MITLSIGITTPFFKPKQTNKKTDMKKYFSILFLFTVAIIHAQTPILSSPEQVIREIKEGALLIVLPTSSKKINAMKKVANDPKTSAKYKKRLQKLINENTEAVTRENNALIEHFNKYYNFSKFYLLPDTLRNTYKEGKREGIFVGLDGKIDANIKMNETSYAVFRKGSTAMGSTANDRNNLKAYIIQDESGKLLDKPFPYYYRINTLKYSLDALISKNTATYDLIKSIVQKLDKKLKRYYEEVN